MMSCSPTHTNMIRQRVYLSFDQLTLGILQRALRHATPFCTSVVRPDVARGTLSKYLDSRITKDYSLKLDVFEGNRFAYPLDMLLEGSTFCTCNRNCSITLNCNPPFDTPRPTAPCHGLMIGLGLAISINSEDTRKPPVATTDDARARSPTRADPRASAKLWSNCNWTTARARASARGGRWDGDGVGLTAMRYGLPPNKPPKTQ